MRQCIAQFLALRVDARYSRCRQQAGGTLVYGLDHPVIRGLLLGLTPEPPDNPPGE
jgi:hypothetical protein